jgi:hypothetical protein
LEPDDDLMKYFTANDEDRDQENASEREIKSDLDQA